MELTWKEYLDGRVIADHPDGFKIIKPKESTSKGQPLFCPVCNSIFSSYYDDEAWRKFECCDSCAIRWAYPNTEKWKSGWRPTKDELSIKKTETPI